MGSQLLAVIGVTQLSGFGSNQFSIHVSLLVTSVPAKQMWPPDKLHPTLKGILIYSG